MSKFIVVGEDYYARKVAESIFADPRAQLTAIYTTVKREGTLHTFAKEAGIVVLDSHKLARESKNQTPELDAEWLININSSVLLSASVLDHFPCRALNLHNGPLPNYAGCHVHQWGIRNGENEFAATIHYVETGVDTGPIVATRCFPIQTWDTGLSLFRTSFKLGTELLMEVLGRIHRGETLPAEPQDMSRRKLYRHKDALCGKIDWHQSARRIVDFVRAGDYRPLTSPSYTAQLVLESGEPIHVFRGIEEGICDAAPGTLVDQDDRGPRYACGEGSVRLIEYLRHE